MQLEPRRSAFHRIAITALAGWLACLLLFSGFLAVIPSLHRSFHGNLAVESQLCVVCLLANAQVNCTDAAPVFLEFTCSLLLLVLIPRAVLYLSVDRRFAFGRGPPSLPAFARL